MTTPDDQSGAKLSADFTKTWRFKVGLFLIIGGHLVLLAGLLSPFIGAGAGMVGAIVVAGQIMTYSSIIFFGKEGFIAIKNKFVSFAKSTYTAPVGRTRHRIGIALLLTNVVTTYVMMIYAWDAFAIAVAEGPAAPVWGLNIEEQGSLVFYLFLAGEISFLVAIYVLGADWWEKFRRIFMWETSQTSRTL